MDLNDFRDKMSEFINIFSGRFCVHLNEYFGNLADIGVPRNVDGAVEIERMSSIPVLMFRTEFLMDGKDISVLLYMDRDEFSRHITDAEDFFSEIYQDIDYIFSEIADVFSEGEYTVLDTTMHSDQMEKIINKDNLKGSEFLFNNIFRVKDRSDIGGLMIFY
jgi:hypothetical protein